MNQKPKIIYILVILWIAIGVLFIGTAVKRTLDYQDYLDSTSAFGMDSFTTIMTFSYVLYTILFIIIIALSFLLAYGSFMKKSWSWVIGLMLSSFLIYFVFQAISLIGSGIIMENLDQMFNHFEYVANVVMIFLVPCLLALLTRPTVKTYFGKT